MLAVPLREALPPRPACPNPSRPDLLFYPMTDWHARIQRTQHLVRAFAALGFRCIYINPHLGREFETAPFFDRAHRLARLDAEYLRVACPPPA